MRIYDINRSLTGYLDTMVSINEEISDIEWSSEILRIGRDSSKGKAWKGMKAVLTDNPNIMSAATKKGAQGVVISVIIQWVTALMAKGEIPSDSEVKATIKRYSDMQKVKNVSKIEAIVFEYIDKAQNVVVPEKHRGNVEAYRGGAPKPVKKVKLFDPIKNSKQLATFIEKRYPKLEWDKPQFGKMSGNGKNVDFVKFPAKDRTYSYGPRLAFLDVTVKVDPDNDWFESVLTTQDGRRMPHNGKLSNLKKPADLFYKQGLLH